MAPVEATLHALAHAADFGGRTARADYWWVVLVWTLVYATVAGLSHVTRRRGDWPVQLYVLATFIPMLALTVRRLHDTGLSGWWVIGDFAVIGLALIWGIAAPILSKRGVPGPARLGERWGPAVTLGLILTGCIALVWQTLLPGDTATNRFGPPATGAAA